MPKYSQGWRDNLKTAEDFIKDGTVIERHQTAPDYPLLVLGFSLALSIFLMIITVALFSK